jgi:hypothetical protein
MPPHDQRPPPRVPAQAISVVGDRAVPRRKRRAGLVPGPPR